jgi:methylated-DNA-[protein]-cysteine S-methyltransferase
VTQRHRLVDSPLGPIMLSADSAGRLTGLRIGADRRALDAASGGRHDEVLDGVAVQLGEYFEGRRRSFDVPVAMTGSSFQRQVWAQLQKIPFGTTTSYGRLAREIGRPGAARAVGHANARNPIAVIVPCHRVVGSSGLLTGYGGGLGAKRYLLDLEAAGPHKATG